MLDVKKMDFKKFVLKNAIYFILLAIVILIIALNPRFFSVKVARDILIQSSVRLVVAMGCMFIIISGSADLSGGRVVGLTALISGSFAQQLTYSLRFYPNIPELSIIVPILASILAGMAVGAFNGWAVSKLRVPAFLATLGTQMIVFGLASLYFNLEPNSSQPLGGLTKEFRYIGTGSLFGIPVIVFVSLFVMLIVWVILTKTTLGKEIFAVGGNKDAAKVCGINVFKIQMFTYTIAGACYGIGGLLEASRTGSATSAYGAGYELDAIASCIVGGCSISGGIGTVPGVFAGVIIFNVINYGLTFVGVSPYWQNVVKGLIIISVVAVDVRKYASKN